MPNVMKSNDEYNTDALECIFVGVKASFYNENKCFDFKQSQKKEN